MNTANNLLFDIQKKVLSTTFSHNMAALKLEMPEIYEFYKNYTPKNVQLTFDQNSNLNLLANDKLVYQGNPLLESNKQVEKFISDPNHLRYQISRDAKRIYEHEEVMENIIVKRESETRDAPQYRLKDEEQIDFIAFMGSGLGYHLESMFAKFAIRSALIFEPDPECFYATLHTIDIAKLAENCRQHGGKLAFKIGGDNVAFVNEIASFFKNKGYFNIAHMYLYRHYLSEGTSNAFKMVHDLAYRYVAGWGFCEDEVIGISHTLTNISTYKYPTILASAKKNKRTLPVFIVGNGPSLDKSFEYLKANQENAIIISSGSALKPLLNNGLIPDIHIEQERPAVMYKWIKDIGHAETLKEINLICLNTVSPKVLNVFKQAFIILKPRDAGTAFIQEFLSNKYAEIAHCNPTVSNAAAAAITAMGFKNLYLFGVDYGFASEEHHHSKGSIYYKDDKELNLMSLKDTFSVPGNFKETVFTTKIFDRSRMSLEFLLGENRDINCVNTSDGAKIKFTNACEIEDLPNFNEIVNKKTQIEDFLKVSFDKKGYSNRNVMNEFQSFIPKFEGYINRLKVFTKNVKSREDLANAFTDQYDFVADVQFNKSKKLFHRFMHGSLNYLQANIMSNTYFYTDKEQQEEYIQFCLNEMHSHLKWLVDDLSENYNKPAKF